MGGCLVHLAFEVNLCREVKSHELKVAGETLDLFLLLLFEHGDRVPFYFRLEH